MRAPWGWSLCLTVACHAAVPPPPLPPFTTGGAIQGEVLDESDQRIGLAEIVVEDSPLKATSDAQGLFSFSGLAPGDRWLVVRHDQYLPLRVPVQVTAQKTLTLTLRLAPDVEPLPPPEAEATPEPDDEPTPTPSFSPSPSPSSSDPSPSPTPSPSDSPDPN